MLPCMARSVRERQDGDLRRFKELLEGGDLAT
jgi:hypothetical protein